MKPKNPAAIMKKAKRSPVPIGNGGAVMSVINQVLANQATQIALTSYIEGRGLPGEWRLEIQNARLVPVDSASEPPTG